jgi:hypothetical protein
MVGEQEKWLDDPLTRVVYESAGFVSPTVDAAINHASALLEQITS